MSRTIIRFCVTAYLAFDIVNRVFSIWGLPGNLIAASLDAQEHADLISTIISLTALGLFCLAFREGIWRSLKVILSLDPPEITQLFPSSKRTPKTNHQEIINALPTLSIEYHSNYSVTNEQVPFVIRNVGPADTFNVKVRDIEIGKFLLKFTKLSILRHGADRTLDISIYECKSRGQSQQALYRLSSVIEQSFLGSNNKVSWPVEIDFNTVDGECHQARYFLTYNPATRISEVALNLKE